MKRQTQIPVLVPDLPRSDALSSYLARIDAAAWYTNNGPLVQELERRTALLLDPDPVPASCVTAASGTAALELALQALALAPATRVLMPAFTFPATVIAVQRAGYRPVLCDVEAQGWSLDPEVAVASAHRHDCRAVVPVATFGTRLDVAAWDRCAERSGLRIVVDGAGALGAMSPGRHVSIAYSLHATKPLGLGEGGLIATRDPAFAKRLRRLANYGFEGGRIEEAGTNAKLSEYAAAVGLAQLDRAETLLARRDALWRAYQDALRGLPGIRLQALRGTRAPANLVIHVEAGAGRCADTLMRHGIETRRWYCPPIHRHPAFSSLPHADTLDVTEDLAQHAIGVPFHTRLRPEDIERVVQALREARLSG